MNTLRRPLVTLSLLMSSLSAYALSPSAIPPKPVTFIYVHGFGEGGKAEIPFEDELNRVIAQFQLNATVQTYSYSSDKLDFINIIPQWNRTRQIAETSGLKLYTEQIKALEQNQAPYYLIGYSLGTRVIADCINRLPNPLNHLKGIYFMGSALPHDAVIKPDLLPEAIKIHNYYSANLDYILKTSFRVMEGKNAGGEVGFDDTTLFINHKTSCTHAHKGGPLARDYTDLAEPLTFLSMLNENQSIPGPEPFYNIRTRVMSGALHWNDICTFSRNDESILIQYNVNTNYYRAVSILPDGKRYRLAWGANMHTILKSLNLFNHPHY